MRIDGSIDTDRPNQACVYSASKASSNSLVLSDMTPAEMKIENKKSSLFCKCNLSKVMSKSRGSPVSTDRFTLSQGC